MSDPIVVGGRYEIELPAIGSGAYAAVYRATDLHAGDVVAVKIASAIPRSEDADRFEREVAIQRSLDNPHIVPILEHGFDKELSRFWYSMPLALGKLSSDLTSFSTDESVLGLMRQLVGGLQSAHDRGVVHRDLTPSNVLRMDEERWAIADFGLGRRPGDLSLVTSRAFGHPDWAPPEAQNDAHSIGPASDVYHLGRILRAIVAGSANLHAPLPQDSRYAEVLSRALKSNPSGRYQTASELLEALEVALAIPESGLQKLELLAAALSGEDPDPASLARLLTVTEMVESPLFDWTDPQPRAIEDALLDFSTDTVTRMRDLSPGRFERFFAKFVAYIADTNFPFQHCDPITRFTLRVLEVTGDSALIEMGIRGLAILGRRHNRFFVRDRLSATCSD